MSRLDNPLRSLNQPSWGSQEEAEAEPEVRAFCGSVEVELGDYGKLRMSPNGADSLGAALINAAAEARKQ